MNKYDPNFYKNVNLMKESEKTRKYFNKIVTRLYSKNNNDKNKNKKNFTEKLGDDSNSNYTKSIKNPTVTIGESITDVSKVSSNLKKDMTTSRISTAFHNFIKGTHRLLLAWKAARIKNIPFL